MTYDDAQSACMNAGGVLASATSTTQNIAIKRLLQGQTGWLGLKTQSTAYGYSWGWDSYSNWDINQPDATSSATQSAVAYGPVSGGAFDDYARNVVGISSITIGYALASIISIQVRRNPIQVS